MSIKAVLFDLDGTLLSMDQDFFIATYMNKIATHIAGYGYDPQAFIKALWKGTGAMMKNEGSKVNEEIFWDVFKAIFPDKDVDAEKVYLDEFYVNNFDSIKDEVASFEPLSREVVRLVKNKGLKCILATNPLFPSIATEKRIAWAGLDVSDFEFFTTYENSTYSKPALGYYKEVAAKAGVAPEECLMVGNDVSDDMVAEQLGMKVFLLTDHLINKENVDVSRYPAGGFKELIKYLESL